MSDSLPTAFDIAEYIQREMKGLHATKSATVIGKESSGTESFVLKLVNGKAYRISVIDLTATGGKP
jgi:hypothetical protein